VRFIKLEEDFIYVNEVTKELKIIIKDLTKDISLFGFYELIACEGKILRLNLVAAV
jgi:hypothetical protein